MRQSNAGRLGIVVLGMTLAIAAAPAQSQNSGFLRNYSDLQETQNATGQTIRGWASPAFTPASYNAVLLDPLVFYPEPKPSAQVSAATLEQMLTYTNTALKQALAKRFKMVDRPGRGVARLRIAITSVAAKEEDLKPYQLVPLAFVFTMASRAAEGTPEKAVIVVEVEATDSATGKLLGERVRTGTGERLPKIGDKDVITLDAVKPLLDQLVAGAFPNLSQYVKPR